MKTRACEPRPDVLLVDLDGRYALIDPKGEKIHILNQGAAWLWQHLDATIDAGNDAAAVTAFIAFLERDGLVVSKDAPAAAGAPERLPMAPAVLGTEPLEVAANNSVATADPFCP